MSTIYTYSAFFCIKRKNFTQKSEIGTQLAFLTFHITGGPIMGGPGMNQGMGMNPADIGHVGPGSMGPGGPNMSQGFSMGPGGPHSMNPGMGGPGMGIGPGMTGPSLGRPMGSDGPVGPRNNGGPTPLMGSTGNRQMNFDVSLKPSVAQMSSVGGPMGPES